MNDIDNLNKKLDTTNNKTNKKLNVDNKKSSMTNNKISMTNNNIKTSAKGKELGTDIYKGLDIARQNLNQNLKDEQIYSVLDRLNDSIDNLCMKIDSMDTRSTIEKQLEFHRKRDDEVLSKESVSRGEVKIKKYTNYYDRHFTIGVTPPNTGPNTPSGTGLSATDPNDFDSPVYLVARIYEELDQRYADVIHVANRGIDTLFVVISHGGRTNFSKEEPIYPGDVKDFYQVYEMRFRSPTTGVIFQVSEYDIWVNCCPLAATTISPVSIIGQPISVTQSSGGVGATSAQFTPIEKANIHNTAVLATTNFLGTDLIPTNTPTTFEIMIAMTTSGNLTAIITRGGNTQTVTFNVTSGPAFVAGGLYTFKMLVHAGDSVNFQYSIAGTIQVFRVQEIDSVTA